MILLDFTVNFTLYIIQYISVILAVSPFMASRYCKPVLFCRFDVACFHFQERARGPETVGSYAASAIWLIWPATVRLSLSDTFFCQYLLVASLPSHVFYSLSEILVFLVDYEFACSQQILEHRITAHENAMIK